MFHKLATKAQYNCSDPQAWPKGEAQEAWTKAQALSEGRGDSIEVG